MAQVQPLDLVIVGHVDHGKSTLIGRLFFDSGSLPVEKYEAIKYACERDGRPFEWAFLMDALEEEQEQNVTIDTAQTYFKTDLRQYVIIDAPGHKEFLKNMLTGAAQADAALLLVDAEEGVREQTQRHAYVLSLLGIQQVIVVINKLDLVGWSERRFDQVRRESARFLHGLGITPSYTIPISAREGDMVAARGQRLDWYDGPTILEALDSFEAVRLPSYLPLRYPIQDVYRWGDERYYAGRVESGEVRVGDEVTFSPSGRTARVQSIEVWGANGEKRRAAAGECVALTFDQELFAERGEVLCTASQPARTAVELDASVFWLGREPLSVGQKVSFKLGTSETEATVKAIAERLDSSTLQTIATHADRLENTEAGTVTFELRKALGVDLYEENPRLGRFVLAVDGIARGGGTIRQTRAAAGGGRVRVVRLDERLVELADGQTADLSREPGHFELEAGEALLGRIQRGERLLIRLRTPEQVASLTRLAFEQWLDYQFRRDGDGSIEVLLYAQPPRVKQAAAADFAI